MSPRVAARTPEPRPPSSRRRPTVASRSDRGRMRLEGLLALEGEMRDAGNAATLDDVAARGLARLLDADSVLLLSRPIARWRVVAASPGRVVDRRAPAVLTVERAMTGEALDPADVAPAIAQPVDRTLAVRAERSALVAALPRAAGPADEAIARRVLLTHAHARAALEGVARTITRRLATQRASIALAAAIAVLSAVPVPLVVLAEAEIVGRAPRMVAAPIDGVVRELLVRPQAPVLPGDPLVRLDDTVARGARDLAGRELAVAQARLARALAATDEMTARAEVPVLRAEQELAEVRLANAEAELERTLVRAETSGIVAVDDPQNWTGRPVRTGERILQLIDRADVEAAIRIAPADMIDLPEAAAVTLHLDAAPLAPVRGRLRRVATHAEARPDGTLAYEARASMEVPTRLGARGVARLAGAHVPLLYLVLRRPLAMLRQATGL